MTELDKLEEYLKEHHYVYQRIDENCPDNMQEIRQKYNLPEGWLGQHQIIVYSNDGRTRLWDAICQWGSYGYSQGLLEVMGNIVSSWRRRDVEGWLTAQDIIDRLEDER